MAFSFGSWGLPTFQRASTLITWTDLFREAECALDKPQMRVGSLVIKDEGSAPILCAYVFVVSLIWTQWPFLVSSVLLGFLWVAFYPYPI